jgi:hypothetical protein
MKLGSRLIFLSTKVASWGTEWPTCIAVNPRGGGPSLFNHLIFLFQNLVMASNFQKGTSHRAGDLCSREPIAQVRHNRAGRSASSPSRRDIPSGVPPSFTAEWGIKPLVPFTEWDFFRDVSLVFALKLDYWAERINFNAWKLIMKELKCHQVNW